MLLKDKISLSFQGVKRNGQGCTVRDNPLYSWLDIRFDLVHTQMLFLAHLDLGKLSACNSVYGYMRSADAFRYLESCDSSSCFLLFHNQLKVIIFASTCSAEQVCFKDPNRTRLEMLKIQLANFKYSRPSCIS